MDRPQSGKYSMTPSTTSPSPQLSTVCILQNRLDFLPPRRALAGRPHNIGHRRPRQGLRSPHLRARRRSNVVGPRINRKLGDRFARSRLAVRLASNKLIFVAQLAATGGAFPPVGRKRGAGVVQGQKFTDCLVCAELLLSLWERGSDNEGGLRRDAFL
jgi:hypothetical protein